MKFHLVTPSCDYYFQVSGTLKSSLKGNADATVTATVQRTDDTLEGKGSADWGDKGKLTASVLIQFPQNRFEHLEIKVSK